MGCFTSDARYCTCEVLRERGAAQVTRRMREVLHSAAAPWVLHSSVQDKSRDATSSGRAGFAKARVRRAAMRSATTGTAEDLRTDLQQAQTEAPDAVGILYSPSFRGDNTSPDDKHT